MKSVGISSQMVVPAFSGPTSGANTSVRVLKEKCEAAKPLGVAWCDDALMLIVYDGQILFSCQVRCLTVIQNLAVTSTSTASPLVWLGTSRGSVKLQHMHIVDPTCYSSLLDSSRCAP